MRVYRTNSPIATAYAALVEKADELGVFIEYTPHGLVINHKGHRAVIRDPDGTETSSFPYVFETELIVYDDYMDEGG